MGPRSTMHQHQQHQCICPTAGYCSKFNRKMSEPLHRLCSGVDLCDTRGRSREAYIETWRAQAAGPVPGVSQAVAANFLPVGDGGGGQPESMLTKILDESPKGGSDATAPLLTISIPSFNEYENTYWTVQMLRLYHAEALQRCELLVIDNNPNSEDGRLLAKQMEAIGVRYERFTEATGSHLPKQHAFTIGRGRFVMHMDCHVALPSGALSKLLDHLDANPDCTDLMSGPLLRQGFSADRLARGEASIDGKRDLIGTHQILQWGGTETKMSNALGTWAREPDWRIDGEPFEVPQQGTGLFVCRRDAFPGFSPHFKGWGGNETYLMEKFRRRGDRVVILPWLLWMHFFGKKPSGAGGDSGNGLHLTMRNYLIGSLELGWPFRGEASAYYGRYKFPAVLDHWRQVIGPEKANWVYAAFHREFYQEVFDEQSARWQWTGAGAAYPALWREITAAIQTPEARTVETGSGLSTLLFSRLGTHHTAIEHDHNWSLRAIRLCDASRVEVITAGIDDGCRKLLESNPRPADLLLIDGPPGSEARKAILPHIEQIVSRSGAVIVDDCHRDGDRETAYLIASKLGARITIHDGSHGRKFAVIGNHRRHAEWQQGVTAPVKAADVAAVPQGERVTSSPADSRAAQPFPLCDHRQTGVSLTRTCNLCGGDKGKPYKASFCSLYQVLCSPVTLERGVRACNVCQAAGLHQTPQSQPTHDDGKIIPISQGGITDPSTVIYGDLQAK